MKKIVINGGEFYKAYLVASFENISLVANTWFQLLKNPKADTMYRIEITRSASSSLAVYCGEYIISSPVECYEETAVYVARNNATSVMSIQCSANETSSIKIYECKKFVGTKVPIVGSNAYDIVNNYKISAFQLPVLQSEKTYQVKLTPLYSGMIIYYQSGEKFSSEVVANTTYSFTYTATGNGNIFLRNGEEGTQYAIIEVNIVE